MRVCSFIIIQSSHVPKECMVWVFVSAMDSGFCEIIDLGMARDGQWLVDTHARNDGT